MSPGVAAWQISLRAQPDVEAQLVVDHHFAFRGTSAHPRLAAVVSRAPLVRAGRRVRVRRGSPRRGERVHDPSFELCCRSKRTRSCGLLPDDETVIGRDAATRRMRDTTRRRPPEVLWSISRRRRLRTCSRAVPHQSSLDLSIVGSCFERLLGRLNLVHREPFASCLSSMR